MGYKMKPNKAALSRFKISKTGKVKRHHAKTSHLMSRRSSKTKRRLGRPAVMAEGMAKHIRLITGFAHKNPNKVAHERALAAKQAETAGASESK